jgi:membrane associated rhomboid family serine protease
MSFIESFRRPFPYRRYNITLALIIVNVGIFFLSQFFPPLFRAFALNPESVFQEGSFWQVFTYMFEHGVDPAIVRFGDFSHIFFNMLGLYMFGMMLEDRLGSIEFLLFYMVCGIGSGLAILLLSNPHTATVGASGAIFGLLLAFAAIFPEARILLFFIIPMRAPVAVLIFAGIEVFFIVTGMMGNISHLGHLAGIVFAFIYLVARLNINPIKVFFGRNRYR